MSRFVVAAWLYAPLVGLARGSSVLGWLVVWFLTFGVFKAIWSRRRSETFAWMGYRRDRKPGVRRIDHVFGPDRLRCACHVQAGRGWGPGWPLEWMVADREWVALRRLGRPTIWVARSEVDLVGYSSEGFGRWVFFHTGDGSFDGMLVSGFGRDAITGNLARLGWPVPPPAVALQRRPPPPPPPPEPAL